MWRRMRNTRRVCRECKTHTVRWRRNSTALTPWDLSASMQVSWFLKHTVHFWPFSLRPRCRCDFGTFERNWKRSELPCLDLWHNCELEHVLHQTWTPKYYRTTCSDDGSCWNWETEQGKTFRLSNLIEHTEILASTFLSIPSLNYSL